MIPSELYTIGFDAFVPATDDNPSCIPFYRYWAGMRNALGDGFVQRNHSGVHNAFFNFMPNENSFIRCVEYWLRSVQSGKPEPMPHGSYSYNAEPNDDIPHLAREMFDRQYKAKYPGKRINSKHAKATWAEKQTLAMELAQTEYDTKKKAYDEKEANRNDEYALLLSAWIEKARDSAILENDLRDILACELVTA